MLGEMKIGLRRHKPKIGIHEAAERTFQTFELLCGDKTCEREGGAFINTPSDGEVMGETSAVKEYWPS